ncbi:hypothetical protein CWE21_10665 [Pseudidiomarina aquimaris]|uniref:Sel1 repeat family protein n=1 Tax=Pseudidiomarina aquimaris TaxID=641841 RepID=A0A432XD55_9GAMM|nr:sel1 repeat family protein [Pseudidiomarina aquimaris]RUO46610.1 hypothetical protein CWE21_10665 [Pseudidiomarina aquimaris]
MKFRTFALSLLFAFTLASCAAFDPVNLGVIQFENGNYDKAASFWNGPAQEGNMYAQHNVGLLWLNGLGNTPKDTGEASHWFIRAARQGYVPSMYLLATLQFEAGYTEAAHSWAYLAARWGHHESQVLLRQKGYDVPEPDLLIAQQRELERQEAEAAERTENALIFAAALLGAAGNYYTKKSEARTEALKRKTERQQTYPSSNSRPKQQQSGYTPKPFVNSFMNNERKSVDAENTRPKSHWWTSKREQQSTGFSESTQRKSAPSPMTVDQVSATQCTYDADCAGGQICIRDLNRYKGVCAVPSRESRETLDLNPRSPFEIKRGSERACRGNTDCKIGYYCSSEINACVRKGD